MEINHTNTINDIIAALKRHKYDEGTYDIAWNLTFLLKEIDVTFNEIEFMKNCELDV